MKFRLVIGLTLAAAAICGIVAYAGSRIAPGPGPDTPFLARISERRIEQIDLSGIDSKQQPYSWSLVREPDKADGTRGGWVLSGGAVGIERTTTVRFLQALKSIRPVHQIDDPEMVKNPEIFGFNRPELTITVLTSVPKMERFAFVFGKKHQFTGRRYLRLNTDPVVYLVDDQMFLAVKKQRSDLELKTPLRFDSSLVDRIEIERPAGTISPGRLVLLRQPGGTWSVAAADQAPSPADGAVVSDMLAALSAQEAEESIVGANTAADADFGLNRPKAVVNLHFAVQAEPNPLVLTYGEQEAGEGAVSDGERKSRSAKRYFLKAGGNPVIFRLKQRPKQDLFQEASYFWPRKPFSGYSGVAEIRITADGRTAVLSSATPESGQKQSRFDFLLNQLSNLEVISYDPPPAGAVAGKPLLIEVIDSGGTQVYSIEVDAPIESGAPPDQASRFPPYRALINRPNQPALYCIISGAEVELFRELFKRMV